MSVPFVLIDIGNTRGKWLYATSDGRVVRGAAASDTLCDALPPLERGTPVLVASVAVPVVDESLHITLAARGCVPWFARPAEALDGLTNAYAEPARLGVDRWLAMLAALQRCRDQRFCLVDAGSALTIDFVAPCGRHEGGFILPGRRLMQRALQIDTGRVRYADGDATGLVPGRSTAEAVGHGVSLALVGAVELALAGARIDHPVDRVLLCGGDAALLAPHIGKAELAPDLVFEGLLRQARLEGFDVPAYLPS